MNSVNLLVYSESGELTLRFKKELISNKSVLKDESTTEHLSHGYKEKIIKFYICNRRGRQDHVIPAKANIWHKIYANLHDEKVYTPSNKIFSLNFTDSPRSESSIPDYHNIQEGYTRWPDFHYIFTDGSKTAEETAAATYDLVYQHKEQRLLTNEASIFTAELYGIYSLKLKLLFKIKNTKNPYFNRLSSCYTCLTRL